MHLTGTGVVGATHARDGAKAGEYTDWSLLKPADRKVEIFGLCLRFGSVPLPSWFAGQLGRELGRLVHGVCSYQLDPKLCLVPELTPDPEFGPRFDRTHPAVGPGPGDVARPTRLALIGHAFLLTHDTRGSCS